MPLECLTQPDKSPVGVEKKRRCPGNIWHCVRHVTHRIVDKMLEAVGSVSATLETKHPHV